MEFSEYIKNVQWGENVLIEHTSLSPYPVLFKSIGETFGWNDLLIIDVLDSSMPVIRWLKLSRTEIPTNLKRIKAGGTSTWGEIILEVDPHKDPGIFLTRFSKGIKEYYSTGKKTILIVMNPERLIPLQNNNPRFILTLANLGLAFMGNESRKAFYFVNIELADRRYLAILEEAFTRVIRIDDQGIVKILKSPAINEEGNELKIGS